MIEELPKHTPRFEDCESLLRRADVIKAFMKEYERMNPLTGDEKFGIVCHSQLIATMTAEGLDENDSKGFKGYTWAENCQLLPYFKY